MRHSAKQPIGPLVWLCLSLTAAILHLGCTLPTQQRATESPPPFTPTLLLSNVPPRMCDDILLAAETSPEPTNHWFEKHLEARKVYVHWYQVGYAYVQVTGQGWLRDQVYREDEPLVAQALYQGWYDGNSDGRLVRDLSLIKASVNSLGSTKTN